MQTTGRCRTVARAVLRLLAALATVVLAPLPPPAAAQALASFPVTIRVDASQPREELRPVWRFFGADEPNYAVMKDGRKLLAELGRLRAKEWEIASSLRSSQRHKGIIL